MQIEETSLLCLTGGYPGQLIHELRRIIHEAPYSEKLWIFGCSAFSACFLTLAMFEKIIRLTEPEFLGAVFGTGAAGGIAGTAFGIRSYEGMTFLANKVRAACAECDNYQEIPGHQP
jgi:hypothetical protein